MLEWGRAFVKEVLGKIVNGNNVLGISVVGRTNFELFKEVFGNQFTYNVSKKNGYSVLNCTPKVRHKTFGVYYV